MNSVYLSKLPKIYNVFYVRNIPDYEMKNGCELMWTSRGCIAFRMYKVYYFK